MSRMSIGRLRALISALPADSPAHTPGKWYLTQKQHWLGWLKDYHTEGAYGRLPNMRRDAEFAYNHIVEPKMLLWLIGAAGFPPSIVAQAGKVARRDKAMNQQSAAIRRLVPWSEVATLLGNGSVKAVSPLGLDKPAIGPNERLAPETALDRESEHHAHAIVESAIPDEAQRLACLRILLEGIATAHQRAPACWAITLFERGLRVNVGGVEAATLFPSEFRLLLVCGNPTADLLNHLGPSPYASTPPGTEIFAAEPQRVLQYQAQLSEAFTHFMALASVTGKGKPRRTPFHRSHSPGVLRYLSGALGAPVPEPQYGGTA